MANLAGIAAMVTAMLVAVIMIGKAGGWMIRQSRRFGHLLDDWLGEPAEGNDPGRPSVLARMANLETIVGDQLGGLDRRLAAVEAQLRPTGGGSLRDAVDRLTPSTPTEETPP